MALVVFVLVDILVSFFMYNRLKLDLWTDMYFEQAGFRPHLSKFPVSNRYHEHGGKSIARGTTYSRRVCR